MNPPDTKMPGSWKFKATPWIASRPNSNWAPENTRGAETLTRWTANGRTDWIRASRLRLRASVASTSCDFHVVLLREGEEQVTAERAWEAQRELAVDELRTGELGLARLDREALRIEPH